MLVVMIGSCQAKCSADFKYYVDILTLHAGGSYSMQKVLILQYEPAERRYTESETPVTEQVKMPRKGVGLDL